MSTKDEILKGAAAVLAKNPGATFAELAEKIGIGRATLYRYFAKRDDLIKALALFSLQEIDEAVRPLLQQAMPSHDLLYAIIEVLIPIGERFHFLSTDEFDVWTDAEVKQVYERQDKELGQLIEFMKQEGKFRLDIPTAWIVAVFDNLIYTAWVSIQDGDIAPNQAPSLVYETLMKGFGN